MRVARINPAARRWQPRVRRFPPRKMTSLADRLEWSSIPEPNSGCTLWFGPVTGRGYGHFKWQKRDLLAHRAAYEVVHGPIPAGLFVCHRCDMPACINIAHLFLGTHEDNMADRDAKGRQAHGATHPASQIDLPLALAIYSAAGYQRDIARQFGTNQTTVWQIKNRNHWTLRSPEGAQALAEIEGRA